LRAVTLVFSITHMSIQAHIVARAAILTNRT